MKIDIYSHPNHGYNLESMVQGVRRALDYGNLNYGSYIRTPTCGSSKFLTWARLEVRLDRFLEFSHGPRLAAS